MKLVLYFERAVVWGLIQNGLQDLFPEPSLGQLLRHEPYCGGGSCRGGETGPATARIQSRFSTHHKMLYECRPNTLHNGKMQRRPVTRIMGRVAYVRKFY